VASAIGLDIGSSAVRAVLLSRSRTGIALDRLGQVVLAPDAVVDGVIRDARAVTESLKILIDRFGFKGRKVAMGVANQQVIVRRVDMPTLPEEGFAETLRYQAAEHLPVPMEQVQFDYEVIEQYENDDRTPMMRVLLIAADTDMVTATLQTARDAKLKPVKLDLDAFAQVRALRDPSDVDDDPDEGEMIVNVGAHLTTVTVHADGVPRFVRTISMGGDAITQSLVSAFDLPWEQAETVKSVQHSAASPYAALLELRVGGLIGEIRNSVDYYRTEPAGVHIRRVVLTGGSSLIPSFDDRLADSLRIDVVHGRPFRGVSIGQVPLDASELESAQPFFAVAMGLALQVLP
jgi:type IV pilus assembly protein PilM